MTIAPDVRPVWRCEGCGRVSQASHRPQHHWRHGQHCGPFAPATIAPDGAVVMVTAPASEAEPELRYRQSTLRAYLECPRRTILASPLTTGTIGSSADLGSAFAATAAEIRRTLRRQGESQIATQEAVEVMREVTATGPWVLDADDYMRLVQMVCNFAEEKWNPARFMAIEQRLSMEIVCPDGEIRTFTGTPDVVIADPGDPPGVVIVDDKTGMARPQSPKEPPPEGEPIRGAQYLSEHGYFQLVGYGALAMHEWPRIQRATLREKNWRWMGPPREATMTRDDLEHVLPYLGRLMMQLDRGLREGERSEFAKPRPGTQCNTRCPVALSCPVPQEQRGLGVLGSRSAADEAARRWVVIRALDQQLRKGLKAIHDETGYCPQVGDGRVVRWKDKADGKGRDFGAFDPPANGEAQQRADEDFVASLAAELAKQRDIAGVLATLHDKSSPPRSSEGHSPPLPPGERGESAPRPLPPAVAEPPLQDESAL